MIVLFVSLPSIIIWIVGVPAFAIFLLNRNKHTIVNAEDNPNLTRDEIQSLTIVKIKYGFLFAGYRLSRFFWEAIILYRKMGIIIVNVFLVSLSPEI